MCLQKRVKTVLRGINFRAAFFAIDTVVGLRYNKKMGTNSSGASSKPK